MLSDCGLFIARINFDLEASSALKKNRNEARGYFEKARVGAESQNADELQQKIDDVFTELQRGQ
jgi:hypothetical protein